MQELPEKKHYLFPGNLFVHRSPHLVTTVLGSCISVCLWDVRSHIGGMNHYLLPLWNGEGLPTPKYGNIAIEKLIDKLLKLGCDKGQLKAKVFGGAAMWEQKGGLISVGERNIALAWDLLAEHDIPIVSSDVGGRLGRKLVFNSGTGEVMMRRNKGLSTTADVR